MIQAIIFTGPTFTVTSYGNGLFYLIKRRDGGGELFLQGDDAAAFREEWTSVENAYPHLDTDTIIRDIYINWSTGE